MKRKKTLSLTARLTIAYTLSSVSLILIATLYLYWSLVHALNYRDEKFFTSKAEAVRSLLSRPDNRRDLHFRIETEWPALTSEMFFVRLMDAKGGIIAESPGGSGIFERTPIPVTLGRPVNPGNSDARILSHGGEVFRAFTSFLELDGKHYTVQIALNRTEESALIDEYRNRLMMVLVVCLLGSAFACLQIARRGLRPIHVMAQTAAKITSSNLDEKMLPSEMPSELAHLAKTFDAMLDRLKASFERLQRFSADIAHELRTPINNISGELQVALGKDRPVEYYKDAIGSCLEECSRISRIIDSLLFLAHAENPRIELSKERVDVCKELEGTLEFYEPAAAEKGIQCRLFVDEGVMVIAERTLFQRAVGNILSNAIKNTERSGQIEIRASRKPTEVEIEIVDSGAGIPPEHLPHLFDRFYRVDASRSKDSGGSGLGLAIVKSIASIHGGDVKIRSAVGVGTRVSLLLPAI